MHRKRLEHLIEVLEKVNPIDYVEHSWGHLRNHEIGNEPVGNAGLWAALDPEFMSDGLTAKYEDEGFTIHFDGRFFSDALELFFGLSQAEGKRIFYRNSFNYIEIEDVIAEIKKLLNSES